MPDNPINKVEDEPLEFSKLKEMLGEDASECNFFIYDQLKNLSASQVLNKPASIFLLQNKKSKDPVGHFMCILQHPKFIEHFDSYGYTIDRELKITGEADYLPRILNESGKKVVESKIAFQSTKNDSETCGRWVVSRIKMRDMFIQEFKEFFEQSIVTRDQKVVLLTYFLG